MSQCKIQNRIISLPICVVQMIDAGKIRKSRFQCRLKLLEQTGQLNKGGGTGGIF